jgi:hypothetical protein
MRIIGCDLHARQQTLAMLDTETGELVNLTLMHERDKVREFYSQLPRPVLVGIEATGSMHWFLNLFLWGEAGAHAARRDPELKRFYRRKLVQKGLGKARVAVARKLGIRLWIMLRDEIDYQEFYRRGQMQQKTVRPVAGMPETGNGATSHRQSDEATRLPEF